MSFQGRIAVATGAAAGIGRATALLFACPGAQVGCREIDETGGRRTAELIQKEGFRASFHKLDVRSSSDVMRVASACEAAHGKIDILFNNAGRSAKASFEQSTDEGWDDMVATNLTGQYQCSRHFLPLLKRSGRASIINHASIDAFLGNPGIAAYSAAKGGLIPLTHVKARPPKYGIRVNCICSGGVRTEQTDMVRGGSNVFRSRVDLTPPLAEGPSRTKWRMWHFF